MHQLLGQIDRKFQVKPLTELLQLHSEAAKRLADKGDFAAASRRIDAARAVLSELMHDFSAREIAEVYLFETTLDALIRSHLTTFKLDGAEELLADFKRLMASSSRPYSWTILYVARLVELGIARVRDGDQTGARRLATTASSNIRLDPERYDNETAMIGRLARIYMALGDEKAALRQLRILQFTSDQEWVLISLSKSISLTKGIGAAADFLRKYSTDTVDVTMASLARSLANMHIVDLHDLHDRANELELALRIVRRGKYWNSVKLVHFRIASAYQRTGKLKRAREIMHEAAVNMPEQHEALSRRAFSGYLQAAAVMVEVGAIQELRIVAGKLSANPGLEVQMYCLGGIQDAAENVADRIGEPAKRIELVPDLARCNDEHRVHFLLRGLRDLQNEVLDDKMVGDLIKTANILVSMGIEPEALAVAETLQIAILKNPELIKKPDTFRKLAFLHLKLGDIGATLDSIGVMALQTGDKWLPAVNRRGWSVENLLDLASQAGKGGYGRMMLELVDGQEENARAIVYTALSHSLPD